MQHLLARKGEQPIGQGRASTGRLHRALDHPGGISVTVEVLANQLQVTQHHRQQIVEVVRDTAGQLADGLHFLRLTKLFLDQLAFAGIAHGADKGAPPAGQHFADRKLQWKRRAILALT